VYSFFNLGAKWSGWSTPCTGRFTPGKDRVPIVHRLGEPQDRSGRVRKISPPTGGIRSVDSPVGSESLYRLLYPGPQRFHIKIYVNILFDDWGNAAHKVSRLTAQNSFIYICLKFEKIIERSMPRHVCGVKMLFDFSHFVIVRLWKKNKLQMLHNMKPSSALKRLRGWTIRRITGRVLFNPGLHPCF